MPPRREKLLGKGGTFAGQHRLLPKRGQERSQRTLRALSLGQARAPRPAIPPRPARTCPPAPLLRTPAAGSPRDCPPAALVPRRSPGQRRPGSRHPGTAAPPRSRRVPSAAAGRRGHLPRAAGTARGERAPCLAQPGKGRPGTEPGPGCPPGRFRRRRCGVLPRASLLASPQQGGGRGLCERSTNSPAKAVELKQVFTPSKNSRTAK